MMSCNFILLFFIPDHNDALRSSKQFSPLLSRIIPSLFTKGNCNSCGSELFTASLNFFFLLHSNMLKLADTHSSCK